MAQLDYHPGSVNRAVRTRNTFVFPFDAHNEFLRDDLEGNRNYPNAIHRVLTSDLSTTTLLIQSRHYPTSSMKICVTARDLSRGKQAVSVICGAISASNDERIGSDRLSVESQEQHLLPDFCGAKKQSIFEEHLGVVSKSRLLQAQ